MQIKKYKWKITIILVLIIFFSWINFAPDFLSKHFHELEESYIEKAGKIRTDDKSSITYVVDKFELRPNSYREIVEISGFAFKELKPEIKNRDIFIILESIDKSKNNYIVKSQLIQRPDVLSLYLSNKKIENYTHVGFYAKFSVIGLKKGKYKVSIMVKENGTEYKNNVKFILKKDKGMVTILPL